MNESTIKTYGELIRKRRTLLNLKQADLSIFLGVNKQMISKYENDQVDLPCKVLNELLKVLKMDLKSFIEFKVNSKIANDFKNFSSDLFAKSIIYYRKKDYYSLSEISKAININRNKLSKIENNETDISLTTFIALANFFKVDYEDFFYSKNSNLYFKVKEKEENEEIVDITKRSYFKNCYIVSGVLLAVLIVFEGANTNVRFVDYLESEKETINKNFSIDNDIKFEYLKFLK